MLNWFKGLGCSLCVKVVYVASALFYDALICALVMLSTWLLAYLAELLFHVPLNERQEKVERIVNHALFHEFLYRTELTTVKDSFALALYGVVWSLIPFFGHHLASAFPLDERSVTIAVCALGAAALPAAGVVCWDLNRQRRFKLQIRKAAKDFILGLTRREQNIHG